jgi:rhomboid family protein
MGIYDRDYYRDDQGRRSGGGGYRGGTGLVRVRMLSVTAWLIIINIVVMVIQMGLSNAGVPVHVANNYNRGITEAQIHTLRMSNDFIGASGAQATDAATKRVGNTLHRKLFDEQPDGTIVPVGDALYWVMDPLRAYGHFSTSTGFMKLEVWRLITFQFLHGGFLHIFFNMFALWIFGPLVEQQLGRKRYLAFYLTCGIFGGLMYLVLNLIGYIGIPMPGALKVEIWTPLIGASAGVFGVLMACAYIAPKAIIRLLFPPISIQMQWFVYGYFAIALYNLITAGHNQGGDAAHVGGALAGYFFIRRPHLLRDFFDVFGDSRKGIPSKKSKTKPGRNKPIASKRAGKAAGGVGGAGDVDKILDKINRDGLASLTDAERRTLAEHSRRERDR